MIRLIRRRLIIPQGDTGTFSIPLQYNMGDGDVAIFSIFNPLTRKTVLKLQGEVNEDKITFTFSQKDTIDLEPRRYLWDVTIYNNPIYDDENNLIDGAAINSYYAPFSLPVCEIKGVTRND